MLSRSPRALLGVFALGLFVAAGCGPNYQARAVVKGKVSLGNKHLTVGTVRFSSVKDEAYTGTAAINKKGEYTMHDAPLGDVKVTVSVPQVPLGGIGRMKGGPPMMKDMKDKASVNPEDPSKRIAIMGDMPDYVVSIPDKFASVESSGLTYTVKKGEQTHDITLNP